MSNLTLLVDGDIVAYKIAASSEVASNWGDGVWSLHADENKALPKLEEYLDRAQETTGAKRMVIALTDSVNWRKSIMPTYKENRADTRKPILLGVLRQYLTEHYEVFQRPTLEGDDVLGILATSNVIRGDKIIASIDKDFRTVPCTLWRGETSRGFPVLEEITEAEADRFHLIQALAGDATDGYPGCPGVGMQTAAAILDEPHVLRPEPYTVTKGARKGEMGTRWVKEPTDDLWACIVSYYAKAGQTEADALRNARVARICRACDYDFKKKEVKLWQPISHG